MDTFGNTSPFQSKPKAKPTAHHQNFIEALKNAGAQASGAIKDSITVRKAADAMDNPNQFNPESWGQQQQEFEQQTLRRQRHKEVINQTSIFNRKDEEVKAQIKAIRDELKMLAKDLANLGTSVEKAIDEEIANPGTYHVNFFERMKQTIILLRKRVSESQNWLAISSSRRSKQQYYWGQVKKSGTKFMLSSERSMVTQTG